MAFHNETTGWAQSQGRNWRRVCPMV